MSQNIKIIPQKTLLIAIVGVVAIVAVVMAAVFISSSGLSGRYELHNEQFNYSKYLDFSAIGNKVTVRGIDSGGDIKGTYTIENNNKLTITGDSGLDWLWGQISDDKQTIFINGVGTFTKK